MTTAVDVAVAKRVEVRAVFAYLDSVDGEGPPPLSIEGAQEHLRGLENLLYLASVTQWNAERSDADEWHDRPGDFVRQVFVRRISYASPLEVVAWFLSGTTTATAATAGLIKVWRLWLAARRERAGTELFEVAANVLQGALDAPIPLDPTSTGYERFTLAAQTLALLSTLEINEEA